MHWKTALACTMLIALVIGGIQWLAPDQHVRDIAAAAITILAPLASLVWIARTLREIPSTRDRLSWVLIGLSLLAYGIYRIASQLPHPSWLRPPAADLLLLGSFVLLWLGLLTRAGQYPTTTLGRLIIITDMLISVGAAVSITTQLSLLAMIFAPGTPPELRVHAMAYPIIALITLICINLLLVQITPRSQNAPRALLVLGIGFLLVGGMWSVYLSLNGVADAPLLCQSLWPVGILLYGVAARWDAATRRPFPHSDRDIEHFPSLAGLLVPLVLVLSAMALGMNSVVEPFDMPDPGRLLPVLTSLGALIVMTMVRQVLTFESNRHLYSALQSLYRQMTLNAATDPLTGLANHGYFMERLDEEMQRARRYQRPLAVIFTDLDYFKQINDTHGHRAGDQALRAVAGVLESAVRDSDLVARYGGEEFVILLPETSLEQATILAVRLRLRVSALELPFLLDGDRRLSISCGVAAFPETAVTTDSLLTSADQAMYRAKQEGRNRVVAAQPRVVAV